VAERLPKALQSQEFNNCSTKEAKTKRNFKTLSNYEAEATIHLTQG